jgi:hypothetical protein
LISDAVTTVEWLIAQEAHKMKDLFAANRNAKTFTGYYDLIPTVEDALRHLEKNPIY